MKVFSTQIKDAIFNTIGSSITVGGSDITINSRLEAHPVLYLLNNRAKLPAVYLSPLDFPAFDYEEMPERVVQVYTCDIYYIMQRDETENLYDKSRQCIEAIAAKLDANYQLGLTFSDDTQIWWSRILRIRSDNEVMNAFIQMKQPLVASMLRMEIVLDTGLS